ncbi:MAG TPA: succinate dehydrogenase, cytochrome b556 subunit [Azospirillaceae bacterium]|nr:succinate dehydrogenase, cytochrome b556 subunit [Azospirillaceae bacterium]
MTGTSKVQPTGPGNDNRPLSPHLSIYRLPLLALMSISNRITGAALVAGTLLLVWWLVAAATGPGAYDTATGFIGSPFGLLLLFGWTVAFWYHAVNGIRHLVWDAGYALDLRRATIGGYITLGATAGLTILTWAVGLAAW